MIEGSNSPKDFNSPHRHVCRAGCQFCRRFAAGDGGVRPCTRQACDGIDCPVLSPVCPPFSPGI